MDKSKVCGPWDDPELSLPGAAAARLVAGFSSSRRVISAECRVLLSGEGSDNLMYFQMWPYVRDLRRNQEWWRLLTEIANYLWVRPFPWRGIRARALRLVGKDPYGREVPWWVAPDLPRP